jgi:hypothetical protein
MASIHCGKCHQTHESVAQVRACYSGPSRQDDFLRLRDAIVFNDQGVARYALRDGDGVRFYYLERAANGFVSVSAQHGDNLLKIRDFRTVTEVIRRVGADPLAAARLYGDELGRCSMCNHSLTTEESRAIGIGPVCLKRMTGAA